MSNTGSEPTGRSRTAVAAVGVAGAAIGAAVLAAACEPFPSTVITINGKDVSFTVDPQMPLLYLLRNDIQLKGPKFGCGLSQCGACTVLLDDAPIRSCVTTVAEAEGHKITTLEGLGTPENPHPVQKAFIDEQAAQCAYCINGMVMEVAGLLRTNPKPADNDVVQALNGHLCRCGTHLRILRAARRAAGTKPPMRTV
jgi:nicotinate dehydrogenase subunit A